MTYEDFKQALDTAFADGQTDRKLSEALGVYKPTVTRWRTGNKAPRSFMYPVILGEGVPQALTSSKISIANMALITALRMASPDRTRLQPLLKRTLESTIAPTVQDIAKTLGVDESTVRRWRNGTSKPFDYEVPTICTHLANLLVANA